MDTNIYVSLSRQLAQFRDLEVTANNLANANTTGYQSKKILFSDYLQDAGNHYKAAYLHDQSTYRDMRNGAFKVTGNSLDVAISGPGYFAVAAPGGTRYTRNGAFTQNADGQLISAEGYTVMDDANQPIQIPPDGKDISIKDDGSVVVDGETVGQLGVFEFQNTHDLTAEGDNTLNAGKATPAVALQSTVKHGVLESSNVEPVLEITHLTEISRSVKNSSDLIEAMYELQRKASRTWLSNQS